MTLSAFGAGRVSPTQITGWFGDTQRFTNLAALRSYSWLMPQQNSFGVVNVVGAPTTRVMPAEGKRLLWRLIRPVAPIPLSSLFTTDSFSNAFVKAK
jgi:hypothetical protein